MSVDGGSSRLGRPSGSVSWGLLCRVSDASPTRAGLCSRCCSNRAGSIYLVRDTVQYLRQPHTCVSHTPGTEVGGSAGFVQRTVER